MMYFAQSKEPIFVIKYWLPTLEKSSLMTVSSLTKRCRTGTGRAGASIGADKGARNGDI